MSMFDADSFLGQTVEGSNSTMRKPMREHEAPFCIEEVTVKHGTISRGERAGQTWVALNLKLTIDSDEAREDTNQDTPVLFHMIFVDLTEDGVLDMSEGSNVELGKLRRAVGQNGEGDWSPTSLEGATGLCQIRQEEDDRDPEIIRNKVGAFAAL